MCIACFYWFVIRLIVSLCCRSWIDFTISRWLVRSRSEKNEIHSDARSISCRVHMHPPVPHYLPYHKAKRQSFRRPSGLGVGCEAQITIIVLVAVPQRTWNLQIVFLSSAFLKSLRRLLLSRDRPRDHLQTNMTINRKWKSTASI